jgi:hypothetical protein
MNELPVSSGFLLVLSPFTPLPTLADMPYCIVRVNFVGSS